MDANNNHNINSNINTNTNTSHSMGKHNTLIKFLQINLQHSRAATNNLMKTTEEDDIDKICTQEPYIIQKQSCRDTKEIKNPCSWGGKTQTRHSYN